MKDGNIPLPSLTRSLDQAKSDLREWGYCLLADVIDKSEQDRLADRLLEQAELECEHGVGYIADGHSPNRRIGSGGPNGEKPVWQQVVGLLNKGQAFVDFSMNPSLHALSAHAFQDMPFDLAAVRGLIQRKGATDGPIHIDQILVPFETPMPVVCNLTVTLSEYTLEKGATRVVPGSHKLRPPHMGGDPSALPEVALEAPPGAAIVWEGRTWHRAAACNSVEDRLAIVMVTGQLFARQMDVYSASLHDHVYYAMTPEQREFAGFKSFGFNCILPRFPGDRSNPIAGTSELQTYIPELRRNPY